MCVRVGASVGHGQEERLLVLQLEVFIGKLLAIDRLATGALKVLVTSSNVASCMAKVCDSHCRE